MIRTDMALEARELAGSGALEGVRSDTSEQNGITVTRVEILNDRGAESLGKPVGRYVTLESPALADRDRQAAGRTAEVLAREIRAMLPDREGTTMVVGLGNARMTPDALGPKVVERIFVTRQIRDYAPRLFDPRMGVVAAISPGVLGVTGIETAELIRGAVERIRPARVICIDSLASRRAQRITTSFQLTDTGIHPGAGVRNRRGALNRETLGVDVLAVGVPMVVDAGTLIYDALAEGQTRAAGEEKDSIEQVLERVLFDKFGAMVVTPKEIDLLVDDAAGVVAEALNAALHDLPRDQIDDFLY